MSLLETKPILMVGPAYGRRYTNTVDAQRDWADGKDFKILVGEDAGRYCSIRDNDSLVDEGYTTVSVRIESYPYAAIIKLTLPKT